MSSRPKKGRVLGPGQVVGCMSKLMAQSSPKHKTGSRSKQAAPQEREFEDEPIPPTRLNYAASLFVPTASRPTQSTYASAARGSVRVDESKNEVRSLSPHSNSEESCWEDLDDDWADDLDQKPAATSVPAPKDSTPASPLDSGASSTSDSDSLVGPQEPKAMYEDLLPFISQIRFKMDAKNNFWWAVYDKLSAKDLKTLLRGRGQAVSGRKNSLISRLEAGDRRRLIDLQMAGRYDRLASHQKTIEGLLASSSKQLIGQPRGRSQESRPSDSGTAGNTRVRSTSLGSRSCPIPLRQSAPQPEDASMSENSSTQSEDSDAVDMFGLENASKPKAPNTKIAPNPRSSSMDRSNRDSLPPTISTQTTASASISSVSQQTPASLASLSGRLWDHF
jgi:hypothetical protein